MINTTAKLLILSISLLLCEDLQKRTLCKQQNQDQYRVLAIYRMVGTWENFAAKYVKNSSLTKFYH